MLNTEMLDFDRAMYPKRRTWMVVLILLSVIALVACGVYRGFFVPKPEETSLPGRPAHAEAKPAAKAVPVEKPVPAVKPAALSPTPVAKLRAAVPSPTATATSHTESAAAPPSTARAAAPPSAAGTPPAAASSSRRAGDSSKPGEIMARARALETAGDLPGARKAYLQARALGDEKTRSEAEARLGEITMALLLGSRDMPEKKIYTVQSGDSVDRIARKFGCTRELLSKSNGIGEDGRINVGDKLRVFDGSFAILISRKQHLLVLTMNGEFCKKYPVAVGAEQKTETGAFKITHKEKDPTWWKREVGPIPHGDERNILGNRWMAIKDAADPENDARGLGIHGTSDESSIGKSVSAGCIRMLNRDVEELYALAPMGASVTVTD